MRKCIVKGRDAYFHQWGVESGEFGHQHNGSYSCNSSTVGIIEYTVDGTVATVSPETIKFSEKPVRHTQGDA